MKFGIQEELSLNIFSLLNFIGLQYKIDYYQMFKDCLFCYKRSLFRNHLTNIHRQTNMTNKCIGRELIAMVTTSERDSSVNENCNLINCLHLVGRYSAILYRNLLYCIQITSECLRVVHFAIRGPCWNKHYVYTCNYKDSAHNNY